MSKEELKENPYYKLVYRRGYIITDERINPPHDHWKHITIKQYHIYYDPLNDTKYIKDKDGWIFLLGRIVDINTFTDDMNYIGQKLLDLFNVSFEKFFDYIDELAGRYILFYGDHQHSYILADATGMRSIFYSKDKLVIASHCELAKELTNATVSSLIDTSWLSTYSSYHLPGHFTPYENIYFLTPNTLLKLPEKKVERFYPRKNIDIYTIQESVEEISPLIYGQLKKLSEKHTFLLSLSGGIDSRTSLAFTRDFRDKFMYFTYSKKSSTASKNSIKSLEIDKQLVKDIVTNLGLRHKFITIDDHKESYDLQSFFEVLRKNTFTNHSFRLAKLYYDHFPDQRLHIRSNILEIGRSFYKKNPNIPKNFSIDAMVMCYSPKAVNNNKVKEAFRKYFETVHMDQIFNFDPYDILYWEYRMGVWHTQLLLESDVAHDTYILFNARKILSLMLSVPPFAKKENTVFHKLIDKNWPILNYWKINLLENKVAYYDKQFDNYGLSFKNVHFSSGSLINKSIQIPIYTELHPRRAKFFIEKSAPESGDFAELHIPLKTQKDQGYHCIVQIRTPYENRKYRGRLYYQVLLNDDLLLEEDICDWKESNQIHIKWNSRLLENELIIRILAKKNCENWNWGRAAVILVERLSIRKESDVSDMVVTATSPFSNIQT